MERQGVGGHAILVRAPGAQRDLSIKLEKYFYSRWMSGGGECEVTMLDRQTYRVIFQDEDAQKRVLQRGTHVIDTTTVTAQEEGQEGPGSHQKKPGAPSSPDFLQQISPVKFSSLIKNKSTNSIELTGTFNEIAAVQHYPQKGWESKWRPPQSLEMLPKNEEDQMSIPSAACKYVMEVYQSEMEEIQRSCNVKIVQHSTSGGATYIKFIPQGAQYSVNLAKDAFTDKVEEAMRDWNQETVDSSITQLPLAEIKQNIRSQWSRVLVIQQDGSFILRGPKKQISQAKMFLEKCETKRHIPAEDKHKSTRRRMPVTLSSSHMATEIPVDARHVDILRKLKSREISSIEQKYHVMMEEKNPKDGSIIVAFRPINGPPDLSPHATHSFIVLLQKTFFNIKKTVIGLRKDFTKDHLLSLQEKLMAGGVDIIMEPSGDSLCLIGHPLHVTFVVDILNGVPDPDRAPASGASGSDMGEPMETSEPKSDKQRAEDDNCCICMNEFSDKKILPKCKHAFCRGCLEQAMAIKPVCPICATPYGEIRGNQPDGTMREQTCIYDLPGYPRCGTIEINYNIPSGIQQANHPHPGKPFSGATRIAYLPNNQEGREILKLLKKAFDRRLIFTVGDSRTSGATDIVTWNDIHHKTNTSGGAACFGYPDPDYLKRVREELRAKGIE